MSTNNEHHVLVTDEGTLLSSGCNCSGELGYNGPEWAWCAFAEVKAPIKFSVVSCGFNHFTVGCAVDGTLWGWGSNEGGQIGLGDLTKVFEPTKIPNTENFVSVCAGSYHSMALDSLGFAWGFGLNSSGQLGLNDAQQVTVPTQITSLSEVSMIACGSLFTLILGKYHVWACGANNEGQLGLGDTITRTVPTKIPGLHGIAVAAGNTHSLVLDFQGQVLSFGSNLDGQLGVKTPYVKAKRKTMPKPSHQLTPIIIPELSDCLHIMCGGNFSVVILSDQRVMVFGNNQMAKLGIEAHYPILPAESPALFGKVLIPGFEHIVVGDLNEERFEILGVLCHHSIEKRKGVKLPTPAYLRKKFGKKAHH